MAKRNRNEDLRALEALVERHPNSMSVPEIERCLDPAPPRRTLQHRLKALVDDGRLAREGAGKGVRYRLPRAAEAVGVATARGEARAEIEAPIPLSKEGRETQDYVWQPPAARKPVGYDCAFLEAYRPNETYYLTAPERAHLREIGTPKIANQPAGTYAKHLLNRLLIDLSWNSSRLEGNTYSLLDTKRLIDEGEEAEGKGQLETQMILNHKDAIEFLVSDAGEIGFNRHTMLNLHALLANNLLNDPQAPGRLRQIGVGIEMSVFHPLETPQVIEQCFDEILAIASAITDPFEAAFFVMVQIPYLQPFDDVNKRVSRLAANLPFIKGNLSPLSFEGVPRALYTDATLGVYELNQTALLRDVFIWAYERSAARYAAVRQSIGEPDPFRLRYRTELREVVGSVVGGRMAKKQAATYVSAWTHERIDERDREKFQETAERELLSLHEGNFARYQIRPSEFAAWRAAWGR